MHCQRHATSPRMADASLADVAQNDDERQAHTEATRRWASERWQSVYRTLRGMATKPRQAHMYHLLLTASPTHHLLLTSGPHLPRTAYLQALQLMLEAELPSCSAMERKLLLDTKFRCVWAYQTYSSLEQSQLDDVEAILLEMERDVGGGLVVAYIEQVVLSCCISSFCCSAFLTGHSTPPRNTQGVRTSLIICKGFFLTLFLEGTYMLDNRQSTYQSLISRPGSSLLCTLSMASRVESKKCRVHQTGGRRLVLVLGPAGQRGQVAAQRQQRPLDSQVEDRASRTTDPRQRQERQPKRRPSVHARLDSPGHRLQPGRLPRRVVQASERIARV